MVRAGAVVAGLGLLGVVLPGIAISRVNVFNYAGFVLGAALVGGIAGGVGGSAGWRGRRVRARPDPGDAERDGDHRGSRLPASG